MQLNSNKLQPADNNSEILKQQLRELAQLAHVADILAVNLFLKTAQLADAGEQLCDDLQAFVADVRGGAV